MIGTAETRKTQRFKLLSALFAPLRFMLLSVQVLAAGLAAAVLTGCVSKSKAQSQAQAAYLAGQQQALTQMQQSREPSVTVVGPVKNGMLPWTEELTVARAVVEAGYYGRSDPRLIIVVRNGQPIRVEPKQLLKGQDVPLQPGDVLQIVQ